MSTLIKPTIGRVVWFYPTIEHYEASVQPHAALVVYVHGERCVNLACFDSNGTPYSKTSVQLVQEGDVAHGAHARWMPYQLGHAAKAEKADAAA